LRAARVATSKYRSIPICLQYDPAFTVYAVKHIRLENFFIQIACAALTNA